VTLFELFEKHRLDDGIDSSGKLLILISELLPDRAKDSACGIFLTTTVLGRSEFTSG
jgi:hypothetical protein